MYPFAKTINSTLSYRYFYSNECRTALLGPMILLIHIGISTCFDLPHLDFP